MFHFYFTGNPQGLVFDVAKAPFSKSIWEPLELYLSSLDVTVRLDETATGVRRGENGRWTVTTDRASFDSDGVVLAVTVSALKNIVGSSPDLNDPAWRASIDRLELTLPFAVWRLWLDKPAKNGRAPFVGTTGVGELDNISLYQLFENESREWSEKHGGSVVELHAYAVPEHFSEEELRRDLLDALHMLYPETQNARVLDERFIMAQDCPAFAPGSHASRPVVQTPFDGITLAGDFVKLPIPSALMERAAASGFMAANHILGRTDADPEPVLSISTRGQLARLPI
jgi:isorenieratene synthase